MVSSARGIKLPAHTAIIRITAPIASPTSAAAVDDAVEHVLALLLLDRHLIFAVVADSKPHALATLAVTDCHRDECTVELHRGGFGDWKLGIERWIWMV